MGPLLNILLTRSFTRNHNAILRSWAGMICPITRQGFSIPAEMDPVPRAPSLAGRALAPSKRPAAPANQHRLDGAGAQPRTWAVPAARQHTMLPGRAGPGAGSLHADRRAAQVSGVDPSRKTLRAFFAPQAAAERPPPVAPQAQQPFRAPRLSETAAVTARVTPVTKAAPSGVVNGRSRHFGGSSLPSDQQPARPATIQPSLGVPDSQEEALTSYGVGAKGCGIESDACSPVGAAARRADDASPSKHLVSPSLTRALDLVKRRRCSGDNNPLPSIAGSMSGSATQASGVSRGALSWGLQVVPSQGSSQEDTVKATCHDDQDDVVPRTPLTPLNGRVRKEKRAHSKHQKSTEKSKKKAHREHAKATPSKAPFAEFAFAAGQA